MRASGEDATNGGNRRCLAIRPKFRCRGSRARSHLASAFLGPSQWGELRTAAGARLCESLNSPLLHLSSAIIRSCHSANEWCSWILATSVTTWHVMISHLQLHRLGTTARRSCSLGEQADRELGERSALNGQVSACVFAPRLQQRPLRFQAYAPTPRHGGRAKFMLRPLSQGRKQQNGALVSQRPAVVENLDHHGTVTEIEVISGSPESTDKLPL